MVKYKARERTEYICVHYSSVIPMARHLGNAATK